MINIRLEITLERGKMNPQLQNVHLSYDLVMPFVPFEGLEIFKEYDGIPLLEIREVANYVWDQSKNRLTIHQYIDPKEYDELACNTIEEWATEYYIDKGWVFEFSNNCFPERDPDD